MAWVERMTPLYVVVDDQYAARMDEVVERLQSAGMRVEKVLGALGAVTGSAPLDQMATIAHIPGVSQVSQPRRQFRVPSPDSDIQ